MKAIDLNEDSLEDLLTYDDQFLDYFNAFLQLPAFPDPLEYDRLIGTFQEIPDVRSNSEPDAMLDERSKYGVSDKERESMLEWCKNHRLPYFLRTEIFRELKLLKLLLKTLDDRTQSSAKSHLSSQIRGYSRQTESYISSLSNSADNSANEDDYDDSWNESSDRYGEDRPMSRPMSLPVHGNGYVRKDMGLSEHQGKNSKFLPNVTSRQNKRVLFSHKGDNPSFIQELLLENSDTERPLAATRQTTFVSIHEEDSDMSISNLRPGKNKNAGNKKVMESLRSTSAPVNYKEFLHMPMYSDFNELFLGDEPPQDFDQDLVSYTEDKASEQQTESDIKTLEVKANMSMQQMKEQTFSSFSGMKEFKAFLADTNGIYLFNFWLDCEAFKDTMSDFDETRRMAARNQLFRDIQDKYKMSLTADARAQLQRAASSYELSHTVFIRTQYDVLRRLRSYWVPRFILHKEKSSVLCDALETAPAQEDKVKVEKIDKLASSYLPEISFVSSLPVDHNKIIHMASTTSWRMLSQGGRKLDSRIHSAAKNWSSAPTPSAYQLQRNTLIHKMSFALASESKAGGPFRDFLSKSENDLLCAKLLFWEAVHGYTESEERAADRLLRMNQAWIIYNNFIAESAPFNIGLNRSDRETVIRALLTVTDFVSVSVFDDAKSHALNSLLQPWMLYLQHDVKVFLDAQAARFGSPDERPSINLSQIQIYCDHMRSRISIRKPNLRLGERSSVGMSVKRKRTPLTESAREQRREHNKEIRRQIAREQRALLKAVQQRIEASKLRLVDLNAKSRESGEAGRVGEGAEGAELEDPLFSRSLKSRSNMSRDTQNNNSRKSGAKRDNLAERDPEFIDMSNSRPMMSLFKKYLGENENKDLVHHTLLYQEIDAYFKTDPKPKSKKDLQANFIYKTYMDPSSKKVLQFNEKIMGRLATEKDRPKSPTLVETQKFIVNQLNPLFKQFFESQAEEFGVDTKTLANMSQAELAMRAETDLSLTKTFNKKVPGGNKQAKRAGRAAPSKEDKVTLMHCLQESVAHGKPPIQLLYFWKYLVKHGDDENNPLIDKDLMFYMEVQKYKELCHVYTDEEIVKKKAQAIIDCFLESAIPPTCQIDISSDMCSRIVKAAVKVMQGKEIIPSLFDEAVFLVFKEILPYWAGFQKTYTPPENFKEAPLTKHQKAVRKRYEEFLHAQIPHEEKLVLPSLKGAHQLLKIASLTYSITEGLKVKTDVFPNAV